MCHNQHHSTQTNQEINPALCFERLASNGMCPDMLLFLAAEELKNNHSFLTFVDTQREHFTCTLLYSELTIYAFKFLTISKLTYYKNRTHCCS